MEILRQKILRLICRFYHRKYWKEYAYNCSTSWRRCEKCNKELFLRSNRFEYFLENINNKS